MQSRSSPSVLSWHVWPTLAVVQAPSLLSLFALLFALPLLNRFLCPSPVLCLRLSARLTFLLSLLLWLPRSLPAACVCSISIGPCLSLSVLLCLCVLLVGVQER